MDQLRAVDHLGVGWMAGILVLALGVLAWVNMVSPRQWTVVSRSFLAFRLGSNRLREDLDLRDRTLTGLLILATVVIAVFTYQSLLYRGWVVPGFGTAGRILLFVVGITVAQLLLIRSLAFLAGPDGDQKEYFYTVIIIHICLGLLLVPVVTLMAYPPRVAWREGVWLAGMALVAALVLFRWVRAVVVGLGGGVPLRYIFIYLCALEILPVGLLLERAWHFIPPTPHP
jgi:hypothetical protein